MNFEVDVFDDPNDTEPVDTLGPFFTRAEAEAVADADPRPTLVVNVAWYRAQLRKYGMAGAA